MTFVNRLYLMYKLKFFLMSFFILYLCKMFWPGGNPIKAILELLCSNNIYANLKYKLVIRMAGCNRPLLMPWVLGCLILWHTKILSYMVCQQYILCRQSPLKVNYPKLPYHIIVNSSVTPFNTCDREGSAEKGEQKQIGFELETEKWRHQILYIHVTSHQPAKIISQPYKRGTN